jgi:hypothetical protein
MRSGLRNDFDLQTTKLARPALDFLAFCLLGSWVFSTDMDCKFFIPPALEDLLHFAERIACRRPRGLELPRAFRAAAALKARAFNPYQVSEHGHLGTPQEV